MEIVERGSGVPLVLIPGLQGRWEYMRTTVDALSSSFRVITFPLCDERSARARFDASRGLDSYVDQIRDALDQLTVQRAVICGVSFGGIVALRFAADHAARTRALVLANTPGPQWHLRRRHEIYSRAPWVFGPLFLAETPFRVRRELRLALNDRRDRYRFTVRQLRTLLAAPISMSRMAARARLIGYSTRDAESRRVSAPTLIVHGEPQLDHVVNVHGTAEYARLIAGSRLAILEKTGHLGTMTRPDAFAAIVRTFVSGTAQETSDSAA